MTAIRRPCPVDGCKRTVVADQLMCRPHWKMVPAVLQKLVWQHFRRAPGRPAHLKACRDAVAAVDAAIAEQTTHIPQAELVL